MVQPKLSLIKNKLDKTFLEILPVYPPRAKMPTPLDQFQEVKFFNIIKDKNHLGDITFCGTDVRHIGNEKQCCW